MTSAHNDRRIDQTGLKVGQALTILLLLAAFVLNSALLVAVVAVAQLLGAADVAFSPYRLAYTRLLRPLGIVKPHVLIDNPEPHRFAMLVGGVFNTVATIALLAGASGLAWVLVWVVIALANLNFWLNFCLGCWMYYQFNRFGLPGFTHAPLAK